jgi:hypothetical protein
MRAEAAPCGQQPATTAPGLPQVDLPQPPETPATQCRSQVRHHQARQHPAPARNRRRNVNQMVDERCLPGYCQPCG